MEMELVVDTGFGYMRIPVSRNEVAVLLVGLTILVLLTR